MVTCLTCGPPTHPINSIKETGGKKKKADDDDFIDDGSGSDDSDDDGSVEIVASPAAAGCVRLQPFLSIVPFTFSPFQSVALHSRRLRMRSRVSLPVRSGKKPKASPKEAPASGAKRKRCV